jgi:putative protease
LNVVILENELKTLFNLLNRLVNTTIDGIIVQDLGLFNLVKKYFPSLDIHASTQLTTHNQGQIEFLSKIGATRTNLSRELNLEEIRTLTAVAHEHNLLTEVFVHGALCIAFSGQCYSSSVSVGNSGNRGRCSQACRDEYEVTATGNKYPLNLKDNSAYFDLPDLVDAKVDSLKIEGRIKGAHYVYTVVDSWRKQINSFVDSGKLLADDSNLHKVFNRNFTNSFLKGDLTKSMFIDNPRDNSVNYAIEKENAISVVQIHDVKAELYQDKNALGDELRGKIKDLNIDKQNLTLEFTVKQGQPLKVQAILANKVFSAETASSLISSEKAAIDEDSLIKRFKIFNDANHIIESYNFDNFEQGLSVPFKELTQMKNDIAFQLNHSVKIVPPVDLPKLTKHPKVCDQAKLSILISDEKDINLCEMTGADVYFKLPESFKKDCPKFIQLFLRNPRLGLTCSRILTASI